jgi:hypothetical protein
MVSQKTNWNIILKSYWRLFRSLFKIKNKYKTSITVQYSEILKRYIEWICRTSKTSKNIAFELLNNKDTKNCKSHRRKLKKNNTKINLLNFVFTCAIS